MFMTKKLLAVLAIAGFAGPVLAQDAELVDAGQKVFQRCAACHMVGPDAKNRVGPELNGVVGRTAGTLEGYKYSPALVDAGAAGLVWNEETLHQFLADPRAMVKGTKMAFPGLKNAEDVNAVIAYIEANGAGAM
jgi:cytochrome c2